jgi:hypothetical protein
MMSIGEKSVDSLRKSSRYNEFSPSYAFAARRDIIIGIEA